MRFCPETTGIGDSVSENRVRYTAYNKVCEREKVRKKGEVRKSEMSF